MSTESIKTAKKWVGMLPPHNNSPRVFIGVDPARDNDRSVTVMVTKLPGKDVSYQIVEYTPRP